MVGSQLPRIERNQDNLCFTILLQQKNRQLLLLKKRSVLPSSSKKGNNKNSNRVWKDIKIVDKKRFYEKELCQQNQSTNYSLFF